MIGLVTTFFLPARPQAYQTALAVEPGNQDSDDAFQPVLTAMVDPLVEMCSRSAEVLRANHPARLDGGAQLDPAAHGLYLINCIAVVEQRLCLHPCTRSVSQRLEERLEALMGELVAGTTGRIMAQGSMQDVMDRIRFYRTQVMSMLRPCPSLLRRNIFSDDMSLIIIK